jgi:hypothetical protein
MTDDDATRITMDDLASALTILQEATQELEAAQSVMTAARSKECNALNDVNAAQKRIDTLITVLKQRAPRDSDWRRNIND